MYLQQITKDLLLPYYDSLRGFFAKIFKEAGDYAHVAFMTPRAAALAGVFLDIITDEDGLTPPDNLILAASLPSMLPDAVLRSKSSWMFPSSHILIVTDIMAYDMTMNRIEDKLATGLARRLGVTIEDAKIDIKRRTKIMAYVRNNAPVSLDSYLQSSFHVANIWPPSKWLDLCNRISRLLLVTGRSMPSYGIAMITDGCPVDAPSGFTKIDTVYDISHMTRFSSVMRAPNIGDIPCAITFRMSIQDGAFTAVPSVTLPVMTEREIDACLRDFPVAPLRETKYWMPDGAMKLRLLHMALSANALRSFAAAADIKLSRAPNHMAQILLAAGETPAHAAFIEALEQPVPIPGVSFTAPAIDCQYDKQIPSAVEDEIYSTSLTNWAEAYWKTQICQEEKPRPGMETTDRFVPATAFLGRLRSACPATDAMLHAWTGHLIDAGILDLEICEFNSPGGPVISQAVRPN